MMSIALSKDDLVITRKRKKFVFKVKYIEPTGPIYCCDSDGFRLAYFIKDAPIVSIVICKRHYELSYYLAKVSGVEPIKVRPYYDLGTCTICWRPGIVTLCDECIQEITQAIHQADKTQIKPILES